MSDEEIRRLERLAAQGDALAQAKLDAMRARVRTPNEFTIYSDKNWTVTIFSNRGAGRVICERTGYVDWWLKYPDGRVVYDWPEIVPKRIKAVIRREANRRDNPDEDRRRAERGSDWNDKVSVERAFRGCSPHRRCLARERAEDPRAQEGQQGARWHGRLVRSVAAHDRTAAT